MTNEKNENAEACSINNTKIYDIPEMSIDIDTVGIIVQAVDGVLIDDDYGEVKLLFYHFKPDTIDFRNETIRCKGVAELRMSRSKFISVAQGFTRKVRRPKAISKKSVELGSSERFSMFG